jgi:hypothetical protein
MKYRRGYQMMFLERFAAHQTSYWRKEVNIIVEEVREIAQGVIHQPIERRVVPWFYRSG